MCGCVSNASDWLNVWIVLFLVLTAFKWFHRDSIKLINIIRFCFAGEINSAFVTDTHSVVSRKSNPLQPVMLMPPPPSSHHHSVGTHDDHFSEFSHRTGRSKSSNYKPEYNSSIRNFQLWNVWYLKLINNLLILIMPYFDLSQCSH